MDTTQDTKTDTALSRLRKCAGITCESDTDAFATTGAFGDRPNLRVETGVRYLILSYSGPLAWVMRGYDGESIYGDSLDDVAADEDTQAAVLALYRACQEEGVGLHFSHTYSGAKLLHAPRAVRAAQRLCEEIRATRIRAAENPHPAHDHRLASLEGQTSRA